MSNKMTKQRFSDYQIQGEILESLEKAANHSSFYLEELIIGDITVRYRSPGEWEVEFNGGVGKFATLRGALNRASDNSLVRATMS